MKSCPAIRQNGGASDVELPVTLRFGRTGQTAEAVAVPGMSGDGGVLLSAGSASAAGIDGQSDSQTVVMVKVMVKPVHGRNSPAVEAATVPGMTGDGGVLPPAGSGSEAGPPSGSTPSRFSNA